MIQKWSVPSSLLELYAPVQLPSSIVRPCVSCASCPRRLSLEPTVRGSHLHSHFASLPQSRQLHLHRPPRFRRRTTFRAARTAGACSSIILAVSRSARSDLCLLRSHSRRFLCVLFMCIVMHRQGFCWVPCPNGPLLHLGFLWIFCPDQPLLLYSTNGVAVSR